MKKWHDQLISNKEFREGQRVLLYDTRLHIFPGKLKSRWIGPFIIHRVYSNEVVELLNFNGNDTLESMDIVSSHSWSHSNQKRRQSTSLSLKKPKQKGAREISQNEGNFCEMSILLPNHSATLWDSLRIFAIAKVEWHTSATSQHREHHFRMRNALRREKPDFAPKVPFRGVSQLRK
ncbi:hypothetical protein AAG906_019596 [Vitis piasezkii]